VTRPSRSKRRQSLTWTDETGRSYTHSWRVRPPASPGGIPRELRLVDVRDAAEDLVAVLVRANELAPPVLYAGVQTLALLDSGLIGVVRFLDDDGEWMAGALGEPQPSGEIACPDCGKQTVSADDLRAKAATRGRKVPVLRVSSSML